MTRAVVAKVVAVGATAAVAVSLAMLRDLLNASRFQPSAVLLAIRLAAAPDLSWSGAAAYRPETASLEASDRAAQIPLPSGGSFDGIMWDQLHGEVSFGLIEQTLEYNAAGQ